VVAHGLVQSLVQLAALTVSGSTRGAQREALISDLPRLRSRMPSEKLAEVAADFDGMHSIQRAVQVIGESSCTSR
jgi:hypothetical protein